MTPEQVESTVDQIAEYLSCGNLHDATQLMGTLLELVQDCPDMRNDIACRFDRVFQNWDKTWG